MTDKFNNNMIVLGEKKKGNGTHEILNLMKEIIDFQDKVEIAAEAQANPKQKAVIDGFLSDLEAMNDQLLEMAKGAIKSVRRQVEKDVESVEQDGPEVTVEDERTKVVSPVAPSM